MQLTEPGIFLPRFPRADAANYKAVAPVEKAELDEVIAQKLGGCFDYGQQHRTAFALCIQRFGGYGRKFIGLAVMFFHGVVAVMQYIAGQMCLCAAWYELVFIVRIDAAPATAAAVPEAKLCIGIPAAMSDPLPAVIGEAVHGIAGVLPVLFYGGNGVEQGFVGSLIGIERENVRVKCVRDGPVFLFDMPVERMLDKARAMAAANFSGAVGGETVEHHNIVGNAFYGIQTAANIAFFVEGDDNHRKFYRLGHSVQKYKSRRSCLPLGQMTNPQQLLSALRHGDRRALARAITLVENNLEGAAELLASLDLTALSPVVGITGPPGAGKSTLINALLTELTAQGKTVAIIAVDPTSPFNFGSLLGDRLRMAEHFTNPNVYIRSLATRGSLGGLSAAALEITDVVRSAGFDLVIVETVGVGQSEVEIAGLADTTVVVLVPEAGDDVQAIKSGIMEIADIFVVNKADRIGAQTFARNLHQLLHQRAASDWTVPVIKTVAARNEGIQELLEKITAHSNRPVSNPRRALLFAEKAWKLIQRNRMRDVSRQELTAEISRQLENGSFQLYRFAAGFAAGKNNH